MPRVAGRGRSLAPTHRTPIGQINAIARPSGEQRCCSYKVAHDRRAGVRGRSLPALCAGNLPRSLFDACIYPDPRFHAWKCRLGCHFLDEEGEVYGFLHMGTGKNPTVGRGSNFRRVWIMANGEQPRKRQVLSRRVFIDRIFRVRIGDVLKRHDGKEHLLVERYSTIQEFLECTARP